jgi:4-amino-4-deoxy-L-arabinose transferase-like glycosyltransferase
LAARPSRSVLVLAALSVLVQLPFLRRGILPLDEGTVLATADALAHGDTLYVDRVTFVAPLGFELLGALLRVFGSHVLVGRLLQLAAFSACTLLVYAIVRQTAGQRAAVLGALGLLVTKPLGFALTCVVNYSQLALPLFLGCALLGLRFLRDQRRGWLAAAGAAAGLTLLTKQNMGLWVGLAIGLVVGGDWLRGERAFAALLRRGGALLAGVVAPLALAALWYASRGALGEMFQYAVLDLAHLQGAYAIPPPPLGLWTLRPDIQLLTFRYAPGPLMALLFERKLSLGSLPVALGVDLLAKGAYYVPLVALLVLAVPLLRRGVARLPRREWSALLLVASFAAVSYASMLYRADWTHLMNVFPALWIACVVAAARLSARWRAARLCAALLFALWLGAGLAVGAALMALPSAPLDTPRGRLVGAKRVVENAGPVVRYLAARPPDESIAVLPSAPLYYFLAGRRMPLAHDLFMPGLIGPRADRRTADELAAVEQVVFDPWPLPFVYSSMPEYAPLTSGVLAAEFRVERVLSPGGYLLERRAPQRAGPVVADLWRELLEREEGGVPGPTFAPRTQRRPLQVGPRSWMFYRAISLPLAAMQPRACTSFAHVSEGAEVLVFLPMFDPADWPAPGSAAAPARARFEVRVRRGGAEQTLFREERSAGPPGESVRVPLAGRAGEKIEIELCTGLAERKRGVVRAGFAEARVERPAAP